jgi:hypothetical protein
MTYIEAVKELRDSPKAVAITFPKAGGGIARIGLFTKEFRGQKQDILYYISPEGAKETVVSACYLSMLLREDFSVEYKRTYEDGFRDGWKAGDREARTTSIVVQTQLAAERIDAAYKSFQEHMRKLQEGGSSNA